MTQHPAQPRHILFVVRDACGDPALCSLLRGRAPDGAEVLVVTPVTHADADGWLADDTVDRAGAQARLNTTVRWLTASGLNARGVLVDADTVQAIADALFAFPADEIVLCGRDLEPPHRFHRRAVDRARKRFAVPVSEMAVGLREPVGVA